MATVELGQPVPDFELPSTGDKQFRLSEQRGKNIVIYFYPKDNTPGCTLEGQNFRDHIKEFEAHNTHHSRCFAGQCACSRKFQTKTVFSF